LKRIRRRDREAQRLTGGLQFNQEKAVFVRRRPYRPHAGQLGIHQFRLWHGVPLVSSRAALALPIADMRQVKALTALTAASVL